MNKSNCCKARTILEKILIAFTVILILCILLIFSSLYFVGIGGDRCLSRSCLKASHKFKEFIDTSVNPCENFYNFACGNFIENYAEIYRISTPIEQYAFESKKKLEKVLQQPLDLGKDGKSLIIAKNLYKKCINDNSSNNERDNVILTLIKRLGGWPLINEFRDQDKFSWANIMVKARKLGLIYDWFLQITEEYGIPKVTFTDRIEKIDENLRENYRFLIVEVAKYFGVDELNAWQDAIDIEDFQYKLLQVIKKSKQGRIKYDIDDIVTFQNKYPDFNWIDFIADITMINRNTLANVNQIDISAIAPFYEGFHDLMAKTSARIQANYFIWKTIEEVHPFLSTDLQSKFDNFILLKNKKLQEKSSVCTTLIIKRMKNVVESAFIRKNINKDMIIKVNEMINKIYNKMYKKIPTADWMDYETRINLMNRTKGMERIIGGPEFMFNISVFDKFYGYDKFNLVSDSLIWMIGEVQLHNYKVEYGRIYRKYQKTFNEANLMQWGTINGLYSMTDNLIVLTPMILQNYFYSLDQTEYLNYGGLGSVIAHEIAHSFELSDSVHQSWITFESHERLFRKLDCLIQERYFITGQNYKNGSDNVVEDFADFIGIDLAYEAYQDVKGDDQYRNLVVSDFTRNQMFWLQYSSSMCYKKIRSSPVELGNEIDAHSTPMFRVLGPLRNSEYFANDFGCKVNTFMNPTPAPRNFEGWLPFNLALFIILFAGIVFLIFIIVLHVVLHLYYKEGTVDHRACDHICAELRRHSK